MNGVPLSVGLVLIGCLAAGALVCVVGLGLGDDDRSERRALLVAAGGLAILTAFLAVELPARGWNGLWSVEMQTTIEHTAGAARVLGLVAVISGVAACAGLVAARGRGRRSALLALGGAGAAVCVMLAVSMWWVSASAGAA